MPELLIDESLCNGCGVCSYVCPVNIIRINAGESPRYCADGAGRCIICGHCQAACPSGALRLQDERFENVEYSGESAIDPAGLEQFLRMRRSVRRYRPEPVDTGMIRQIMDVVRYAPSGTNRQPVSWIVIHDSGELNRLKSIVVDWMRHMSTPESSLRSYMNFKGMINACEKGKDPVCRNAPHLLLACVPTGDSTARIDAIIALSHFEIAANARGIGTCWGGFFQMAAMGWQPLREALGLGPDREPVYAMMFGHPEIVCKRIPQRNRQQIEWR